MAKISMNAARVNAGFTQEEIAEKLGISRQTYASWETGKTEMKIAHFIAFCQVTGFSTDDVFLPCEFAKCKEG